MILTLHRLRIHLQTAAPAITHHWQQLLTGWPLTAAGLTDTPDLRLRLSLVEALPPLPQDPPFFSDSQMLPDNIGILSVYQGAGDQVMLHFLDGALVTVPLYGTAPPSPPTAAGVVTPAALNYGRFEDITFTSLAPLLRRRDYFLVHAFGVSKEGRALLMVGPTGSGKTTIGLSMLLAGWRLLANDALLLERRADGVYALPTPGPIGVRAGSLRWLPDLQEIILAEEIARGHASLSAKSIGGWGSSAKVTAVYFPQIEERERSTLQPLNRAICLARLLAESVDQWDPAMLPAHMDLLQALTLQAAPYALHLGQDVGRLPDLLSGE